MRPPRGRTSVSTRPMWPHPADPAMSISPEHAALKARERVDALRDLVPRAAPGHQRIDAVEREVFRQRLAPGHPQLSAFLARHGDGDLGPEAETTGGRIARRL